MKNLIAKELKLCVSPIVIFFSLLSALVLIPQYPYFVAFIYPVFSIQICFQFIITNKDSLFMATLPIERNSIVKARHILVVFIELLQLLVAVPFALLSSLLINKGGSNFLEASFALFGFVLIGYTIFNLIFLPAFFKTNYKWGIPLLIGTIVFALFAVVIEVVIAVVPALNSTLSSLAASGVVWQLLVLLCGILIYIGGLILSYKLSVRNFDKAAL